MLVGGPGAYAASNNATTIEREQFYSYDDEDRSALNEIAVAQINANNRAATIGRLPFRLARDRENGGYLPFEHVRPDDLVTVDASRDGVYDFNESDFPVGALQIILRRGGDWEAFVDLGVSVQSRRLACLPSQVHHRTPHPQPAAMSPTGRRRSGHASDGCYHAMDPDMDI